MEGNYETHDFHHVSLLHMMGQKIVRARRYGRRVSVAFEDGERCRSLIQQLLNNELHCPVKEYIDAMRAVKTYFESIPQESR